MHLDDLNYLLLLDRAEPLLSVAGHGAVCCVAFFAFNRTKKPVFLLMSFSAFLGMLLAATYLYHDLALTAFGLVFHGWYMLAQILNIILGVASGIWLILYAWQCLGKIPPPLPRTPLAD